MQYELVTDSNRLQQICDYAREQGFIALDTEFVRTRTLYPKLGLIQLYDGKHMVLIDPLAIEDLAPLTALLVNEDVVKVLHSCSEDLETFWHFMRVIPAPVFDTQFAASLLNMGNSLGYARMVELMLQVTLDKGESRTDWTARPLSEQQCQYAANDVFYLHQIYPQLQDQIVKAGRLQWVYQEISRLAKRKMVQMPPELAYLSVKNNWKLHGRSLYLLQKLAAWRLNKARESDLALNFVLREQNMFAIAQQQPQSMGQLFAIPGILPQEAKRHGKAVLAMVAEAKQAPPELYPATVERLNDFPAYKKTAGAIRQLCLSVAERENIPVELLGSKKQVNQLLKWLWFELDESKALKICPDLLEGWRAPLLADGLNDVTGIKLQDKLEEAQ